MVIHSLIENDLYDNTIIAFTCDNGGLLRVEANNGLLRDGKGRVYEGGLIAPTAIVWKNHISPGSVTDYKAVIVLYRLILILSYTNC